MKATTYKKINRVLFGLVFICSSISIQTGFALIAFFLVGFYMVLISLLKTRVDEGIIADERQKRVSEKAAQISFQILLPILLLTTIVLIAGGDKQEFHYLKALGVVFSYITSLGLVIYLLTYWYFDKKTGGR